MELTETFFFTYVNIKKPFLKFSKTFIQQRIGAGLHAIIIIFFINYDFKSCKLTKRKVITVKV